MSYDLVVFDVAAAPAQASDFWAWLQVQTRWEEDHSYDDPACTTAALRAWFLDIIVTFPAMNGPYRPSTMPENDSAMTDYSIGRQIIFAGFAWSLSALAYERSFALAEKHALGFCDLSASSEKVWLPSRSGALRLAFERN